jgi:hypothetical protein
MLLSLMHTDVSNNHADNFGVSPLLEALKGGHDSAAKILLNYGAKPQLQVGLTYTRIFLGC